MSFYHIFTSERPDAEVSALDVLLNNELWTDAISLTKESCKEVVMGTIRS